jgi:hypothetical protein
MTYSIKSLVFFAFLATLREVFSEFPRKAAKNAKQGKKQNPTDHHLKAAEGLRHY